MKLFTMEERWFLIWVLESIKKHTLCRLGYHDVRLSANGKPPNYCSRGCRHTFNLNAMKPYKVTLNSGEEFMVDAVNEYHAGSKVVYGNGPAIMDQHGQPIGEVQVHRENIRTIELLAP